MSTARLNQVNSLEGHLKPITGKTEVKALRHVTQHRAHLHLVASEGQLQVHTATFRGSFSGVLSSALRAAGLGSRVMIVQFLKGGVNQGPKGCIRLCGKLQWLRPSIPICISQHAHETTNSYPSNYLEEVKEIWNACKSHLLSGEVDQLVLDELGLAISLGYIKEKEVISTLKMRPCSTDVILTGPSIPSGILAMADQITQLRINY